MSTLNEVVLTNLWSRWGELNGSGAPFASTLTVLSSSVHVMPPSSERRNPTPVLPVSPSPVEAKTIDCFESLLRAMTAMLPMFSENVGPKSVTGMYVGPFGSVVRKLVVFQMPPLAPATKTVLPVGSDGSMARPPMRPEWAPLIEAGPTAVHTSCDSG